MRRLQSITALLLLLAAAGGLYQLAARFPAQWDATRNALNSLSPASAQVLAQLMSPMVPHLAEDLWAMLGGAGLVAQARWPKADPLLLTRDTVTLPIQINGKRRAEICVPKDMPASEVEKLVLADEDVIRFLGGVTPKKLIVVPGRIVNVVI
ncbi:MAG: hypothetical protein AUK60_08730 [Rhodobacteraceae bacterium CG2_30_10_405]|nr:MAG: hypothetical protein AUK60_08730 [Rhodobacteraceae bacterium CG2_30_10_405]